MAHANTQEDPHSAFQKAFRGIARHKHRYDVFKDFIFMSAITLHNAINMEQGREDEYLKIIATYGKEDQHTFPQLFALLVEMLDTEPRDVLGPLYMNLEIANKDQGQFFTPSSVSEMMARMTYGPELQNLKVPFITLSEPASGAGGMVLSFVKAMIENGHNPSERLWVQCIDIDRLAALMCYIQLSLWNVPAEIIVGDTLRLEFRETWYTPAHYLGRWSYKLAERDENPTPEQPIKRKEPERPETAREDTSTGPVQFDFGF